MIHLLLPMVAGNWLNWRRSGVLFHPAVKQTARGRRPNRWGVESAVDTVSCVHVCQVHQRGSNTVFSKRNNTMAIDKQHVLSLHQATRKLLRTASHHYGPICLVSGWKTMHFPHRWTAALCNPLCMFHHRTLASGRGCHRSWSGCLRTQFVSLP